MTSSDDEIRAAAERSWNEEPDMEYNIPSAYKNIVVSLMIAAIKRDREERGAVTCEDCGEVGVRPFDNGDGIVRCEQCAVKKYNMMPPYRDDLEAMLVRLAKEYGIPCRLYVSSKGWRFERYDYCVGAWRKTLDFATPRESAKYSPHPYACAPSPVPIFSVENLSKIVACETNTTPF